MEIKFKKEMVYEPYHFAETICEGNIDGIDFKIKSLGSHPTAYVKVPKDSIYYGEHYDDIPIDCHGGLTYSRTEEDGYWIGWDYAHFGDYCYSFFTVFNSEERKYTVNDILKDVKSVVKQLNEREDNL